VVSICMVGKVCERRGEDVRLRVGIYTQSPLSDGGAIEKLVALV
jgi:hypothetical protein